MRFFPVRSESPSRRVWPMLLGLGLIGLTTCSRQRLDAQCDIAALEAHAPDLDAIPLDDAAVLALGGEALADVLKYCTAMEPWTEHAWRLRGSSLTSRISSPGVTNFETPPRAVLAQARRTCPNRYDQLGEIPDLERRVRNYIIFDACGFEKRGILSSSDIDYVAPQELPDWRIHQMLLESNLPEDLARRYFTAILLAFEIDERANAAVRVHNGKLAIDSRRAVQVHGEAILRPDGRLDERSWKFASPLEEEFELSSGCISGRVSISATEPIGHLRWLFDADTSGQCSDGTLTIAIFERKHLLRPLRADLDTPVSGFAQRPDLELSVDSSGGWRSDDSPAQSSAVALEALLDRREPSSLRVRASSSIPAAIVVDLLRVADVWRVRERRKLKLWLLIEEPET